MSLREWALANNPKGEPKQISLRANKSHSLKKGKTKMEKSEMMNLVLDACVAKYNLKSRTEAYPFVIGMATVSLSEESLSRMLDSLN